MSSFFRWIDFLKPKISLMHRGDVFEYSPFTGIVSLVQIILTIASIFYFSKSIIWRQQPTTHIYEGYSEDKGFFSVNSSSFSHFITFNSYNISNLIDNDFNSFLIIGMEDNLNYYVNLYKNNKSEINHWLYGPCDKTDFQKINNIFEEMIYNSSACIKKYYNSDDNKYYDKNDKNFKWPQLTYGNEKGNNKQYSVIIQKCEEDTINLILGEGSHCRSDLEIENILDSGRWVLFNFLDYDIDLYDYNHPNSSYWYTMENNINNDYLTLNYINFNPITVKTNKGIVFERTEKKVYYEFSRNDVFTQHKNPKNVNIYMYYNIILNNRMKYYERRYKKLQDIIAQIGGFVKIIGSIASFIVRYYNEFKILRDIRDLISHSYQKENGDSKNYNISNNSIIKINNDNMKEMNDINNTQNISQLNPNINNQKNIINPKVNEVKENEIDQNLTTKNNDKEEKDNTSVFTEENKKFNIFSYIAHRYTLRKTFKKYSVFNNFKNRLLSDEQLIKNHLILFNIRHNRKPNTQIYSLKEIIDDK